MDLKHMKKLRKTQIEILDYIVEICEKNNLRYSFMGGTLLGAIRHNGYIPWDDDIDICMPRKDYEEFKKIFPQNEKYFLDDYSTNKKYWLPFIKIRNSNTIYKENLQSNYNGNSGVWIDIFPLDNADRKNSFLERFQFRFTGILRTSISIKSGIKVSKDKFIKRFFSICFLIFPKCFLIKLQYWLMTINKNDESEYLMSLGSQYGYKKQIHLRNKWFPTSKHIFEDNEYNIPNDYNYVLKNIYGDNYMKLPPKEKQITHNPIKIKFEDGEEIEYEKDN